jgi:hypothetical protein
MGQVCEVEMNDENKLIWAENFYFQRDFIALFIVMILITKTFGAICISLLGI